MHDTSINVPANVNQIQLILPRLPYDVAIIGVFFKQRLEYNSLHMLGNVCPNMVMVIFYDIQLKRHYTNI